MINRGSCTSSHALSNLLNELGKCIRCVALPSIYLSFATSLFNKCTNIAARKLDSIDPQPYSGSAIHSVFTIIFIFILGSLFFGTMHIFYCFFNVICTYKLQGDIRSIVDESYFYSGRM